MNKKRKRGMDTSAQFFKRWKPRRLTMLKRVGPYIAASKGSVLMLLLVSAATVPVSMVGPRLTQRLIDEVMAKGNAALLGPVAAGFLLVFAVQFLLGAVGLYCSNRLLNRFTLSVRGQVWEKLLHMPYADYEKQETGDLKMRLMDDVDSLGNFVKEQAADYLTALFTALFALGLSLWLDVRMTLLCLMIVPAVFLVNFLIGRGTQKVNEEIRQVNEEYYTFEHNAFQFWKEIKAQCVEEDFIGRFHTYRTALAKLGMRSIRYWFYNEVFTDFKANYMTKVLVYVVGVFAVMDGRISVGSLIMFGEYFGMLVTALDTLNGKSVALRVNAPYYDRVFETLHFPQESVQGKRDVALRGNISLRGVSFTYASGEGDALQRVNLDIRRGDYVAVIGRSGCGKTTLAKLILGLYPPEKGRIYFDGVPAEELTGECIHRQIGVVMQDSILFNMSIRDNLRLAAPEASDGELREACRRAGILSFIEKLPEGFGTMVGERGVKLSGGQRQRLAIARVLLRRPKVILFDEATSALDRLSEDVVNRAIDDISRDMTVLVISHKPVTVHRAKTVVVIEDGAVTGCGSHEQLLYSNGFYRKLAGSF